MLSISVREYRGRRAHWQLLCAAELVLSMRLLELEQEARYRTRGCVRLSHVFSTGRLWSNSTFNGTRQTVCTRLVSTFTIG